MRALAFQIRADHQASPPATGIGTPIRASDAQSAQGVFGPVPWSFPTSVRPSFPFKLATSRQKLFCGQRKPRNLPVLTTVSDTERKSHVIFPRQRMLCLERQDASSITASMLIRASAQGSAEAQGYLPSPIRAAGRICADGQGQVPGHSYNCAVGATGRMTWAEVGFGTGAPTARACSLSAWSARGRHRLGRPCAVGAAARAPSD